MTFCLNGRVPFTGRHLGWSADWRCWRAWTNSESVVSAMSKPLSWLRYSIHRGGALKVAVPIAAPAYQGLNRSVDIPACVLSVEDFRRLFADLDTLTREVTGAQIDSIQQPPGVAPADFAREKAAAKAEAGLSLWAYGKNGEQVAIHSAAAITREALPDRLRNITFDSAARFNIKLNYDPVNRFRLNFDFTEPVLFVGYDPWSQPTPNLSRLEVIGPNQTWVAGVCDRVLNFLKARKRSRVWLHRATTFSVFNWLIGFPASFWIVYRVDSVTQRVIAGLPGVIRAGFYVYIFLIALMLFRVLAYVVRWLFPLVELEGSRSKGVRAAGSAVVFGLLSTLIYDIVKTALK